MSKKKYKKAVHSIYIEVCVVKDCKEKAFEFGRCLEHSKEFGNDPIDNVPFATNWLETPGN